MNSPSVRIRGAAAKLSSRRCASRAVSSSTKAILSATKSQSVCARSWLSRPGKKKSSASRIASTGALEIAMAWLRAAAGPWLTSNRATVSRPLPSPAALETSAVPSLEPSSTTMTSAVSGYASADMMARPIVAAAFFAAMMTQTSAFVFMIAFLHRCGAEPSSGEHRRQGAILQVRRREGVQTEMNDRRDGGKTLRRGANQELK